MCFYDVCVWGGLKLTHYVVQKDKGIYCFCAENVADLCSRIASVRYLACKSKWSWGSVKGEEKEDRDSKEDR